MNTHDFALTILEQLPFEPTEQQLKTAAALAHFCAEEAADAGRVCHNRVFIFAGYAGTGKTSLVGALVKALRRERINTVLLAPTGRAAKVFGALAGEPAYTIHRKIYSHALAAGGRAPQLKLGEYENTVFIVDEASMIPDARNSGPHAENVLYDLIQYVYMGRNCRLIVVGDRGQLPPVGMGESPALDPDTYRGFGLKVTHLTLTQVARQQADSGILAHATAIRRILMSNNAAGQLLKIDAETYPDVSLVPPEELPDLIDSLYRRDGVEQTVVITRSNESATRFNEGIRSQVLYHEDELMPGDVLVVSKNNYHWTRNVKGYNMIANGELLQVRKVYGYESRYGIRFANALLSPIESREIEFEARLLLSPLHSDCASAEPAVLRSLQEGVLREAQALDADLPAQIRLLERSPFFNALQVKYGYAMTCHKAQGGQWQNVIIDLSYIPVDSLGAEFYRWLYTAITRARRNLYFISPPEDMLT